MPKNLFVITARAGSKGLPGKNYREIFDQPLIWWSMNALAESKSHGDIVLSTNCAQCMNLAELFNKEWGKHKITIVERPEDLCSDSSSSEDAMTHALEYMISLGKNYKNISLIQPTSPARPNNLVDRCISKFESYQSDSLLTVSAHTPFFYRYDTGGVKSLDGKLRKMRQEMTKSDMYYHDNGNFYITRVDKFKRSGRITDRPLLFECNHFESMQIDTEDDFALMEIAAEYYGGFL